jgi:hypothetical protein
MLRWDDRARACAGSRCLEGIASRGNQGAGVSVLSSLGASAGGSDGSALSAGSLAGASALSVSGASAGLPPPHAAAINEKPRTKAVTLAFIRQLSLKDVRID